MPGNVAEANPLEKRIYSTSQVKNKVLRQAIYRKNKILRLKEKKERQQKRKKEREALGDKV